MANLTAEKQAKDFIYELKNSACEYGFRTEGWELSMATLIEKERLEKKYYPFFAVKVQAELLSGIFLTVAEGLRLEPELKEQSYVNPNRQFLIAFNRERLK